MKFDRMREISRTTGHWGTTRREWYYVPTDKEIFESPQWQTQQRFAGVALLDRLARKRDAEAKR